MPDYYTRQARKALRHLLGLFGYEKTRTDIINRAIVLYDLVEAERRAGNEVYVKRGDDYVPLDRLDWE